MGKMRFCFSLALVLAVLSGGDTTSMENVPEDLGMQIRRLRFNNPKNEVHVCGVLMFYHVFKTGGISLYNIVRKSTNEHVIALDQDYAWETIWERIETGVDAIVDHGKEKKNWLGIGTAGGIPGLVFQFPRLQKMRRKVEAAGCLFVATTLLRQPEKRFWSWYFFKEVVAANQGVESPIPKDPALRQADVLSYTNTPFTLGNFLYFGVSCIYPDGFDKPECYNPEKDLKKKDYLDLNQKLDEQSAKHLIFMLEHFDIVGRTSHLGLAVDALRDITALDMELAPHMNSNSDSYKYEGFDRDAGRNDPVGA